MPNVIGVLHQQPEQVIPVVTKESARQVQFLEAALRAAGSSAEVGDAVEVLPFDLDDCLKTIGAVVGKTPELSVNWTGGTKIMSFAARKVAEASPNGVRAIYVNTAGREIIVEKKPGEQPAQQEILDSAKLGINTLVNIAAAGHTVEGGTTLEAFRNRHTPAPTLVTAAEAILDARPMEWNDLFKFTAAEHQPYIPQRLSPQFLLILEAAKIIERSSHPNAFFLSHETLGLPFHRNSPQEENSKFIRGGYLEVFLWNQLKTRGAFDDVAWHVTLNPGQKGRAIELDVAVAGEGHFLIVECKGRIELRGLADLIEEQYARTRRIGRLFGHWLVYIHQFKDEFTRSSDADIIASQEARARDYGGRLVWHDDLADFPIIAATFLNEAKPAL